MNLANKISIFRILLVPGIVASLLYYHPDRDWMRFITLSLFLVGILSDALDGYIARHHHQQTDLGTILDPIADKCLILSTLISCAAIHGLPGWMRIPAWFNVVVISRDALLVAGSIVLFATKSRWSVTPSWLGKWTTAAQMLVIAAVLLHLPMKDPLLAAAALLTGCSAAGYIRSGIRALG